MSNADELKMSEAELVFWERVRARGALWYLVSKGLLFLVAVPALGCLALDWTWDAMLMVEGWIAGVICGGFVWMRRELRYRFTLECQGRALPDVGDD